MIWGPLGFRARPAHPPRTSWTSSTPPFPPLPPSPSYLAVSILYLRSQRLLNGPPRHLLPWARIPRVCWLGPEPQGTPNHTFLSPNGSPWHHLGPGDRAQGQNFGANLARGVPPPQSQLFFLHIFGTQNANMHFFVFFLKMDCPRHGGFALQTPQSRLLWLGWLACCAQPWLGLAWACLACLASNNNRPQAASGSCAAAVVLAGPGQGKAGKAGETGPGQTKSRLGTTGKPAKPRQSD